MKKYKPYIIFVSLIAVGLSIFSLISAGYYPVVSINGHLITARKFLKNYQVGSFYYEKILKVEEDNAEIKDFFTPANLKRLILNQLVENVLIKNEVKNQLGKDLNYIIENKISKLSEDEEIKQAAQTIYGLEFADFKEEILIPIAEQEILSGRLFLEGKKLEDWLVDAKKNVKIVIFSDEFYWDGKEIQIKK